MSLSEDLLHSYASLISLLSLHLVRYLTKLVDDEENHNHKHVLTFELCASAQKPQHKV